MKHRQKPSRDSAQPQKRHRMSHSYEDPSFTDLNPADYVQIVETFKGQHRTGPLVQSRFNFKITQQIPTGVQGFLFFNTILNHVFKQIVDKIPSDSRAQIFLRNDKLHKSYISTSRAQPHKLRLQDLTDKLIAAIHSDDNVTLEDTSIIVSTLVDPNPR